MSRRRSPRALTPTNSAKKRVIEQDIEEKSEESDGEAPVAPPAKKARSSSTTKARSSSTTKAKAARAPKKQKPINKKATVSKIVNEAEEEGDAESEEVTGRDEHKPLPKDKRFRVEGEWPRLAWNSIIGTPSGFKPHLLTKWKHFVVIDEQGPVGASYSTPVEDAMAEVRAKKNWDLRGFRHHTEEGAKMSERDGGSPLSFVQWVSADGDARLLYSELFDNDDEDNSIGFDFALEVKSIHFALFFSVAEGMAAPMAELSCSAFQLERYDVDKLPDGGDFLDDSTTAADVIGRLGEWLTIFLTSRGEDDEELEEEDE